jgi:hypothetical protein
MKTQQKADQKVYDIYFPYNDTYITIIKLWSGSFIATYGNKTERMTLHEFSF